MKVLKVILLEKLHCSLKIYNKVILNKLKAQHRDLADSGVQMSRFGSQLYFILPVYSWASYLTSQFTYL